MSKVGIREQGERRESMQRDKEGTRRGKAIQAKEKVRGRGGEERRERTGVCRARSAGLGARDRRVVPGARVRSAGAPAWWARGPAAGSWGPARRRSRRRRRRGGRGGRLHGGRLCTPRAPGAALGRICTLPREAPAWRWPSAGASSGALRARWIGHPRNRPTFPLLSLAGLRDGRSRRGAERRRGGWGGGRGHQGHGF